MRIISGKSLYRIICPDTNWYSVDKKHQEVWNEKAKEITDFFAENQPKNMKQNLQKKMDEALNGYAV